MQRTAEKMEAIFHAAEIVRTSEAAALDQIRAARSLQVSIGAFFRNQTEAQAKIIRSRFEAFSESLKLSAVETPPKAGDG